MRREMRRARSEERERFLEEIVALCTGVSFEPEARREL
jgi:hypothetical protein